MNKQSENNKKETKPKHLNGIVVSNKMQKTLVVVVNRLVKHSKYKKRIKISKRYKAHYESGEFKEGDAVTIQETRPLSKDKRWKVTNKLS